MTSVWLHLADIQVWALVCSSDYWDSDRVCCIHTWNHSVEVSLFHRREMSVCVCVCEYSTLTKVLKFIGNRLF